MENFDLWSQLAALGQVIAIDLVLAGDNAIVVGMAAAGVPLEQRRRVIFWGIGATSYRGTHITVDLLWANVGPKYQRAIDIFATLVLLFVVAVQTITLYDKVWTTRADNVLTFDLRLPTWPFFLLAWLGDVSAVILIALRTYRLIFHPELIERRDPARPVE